MLLLKNIASRFAPHRPLRIALDADARLDTLAMMTISNSFDCKHMVTPACCCLWSFTTAPSALLVCHSDVGAQVLVHGRWLRCGPRRKSIKQRRHRHPCSSWAWGDSILQGRAGYHPLWIVSIHAPEYHTDHRRFFFGALGKHDRQHGLRTNIPVGAVYVVKC
jgi:hypothetical protein